MLATRGVRMILGYLIMRGVIVQQSESKTLIWPCTSYTPIAFSAHLFRSNSMLDWQCLCLFTSSSPGWYVKFKLPCYLWSWYALLFTLCKFIWTCRAWLFAAPFTANCDTAVNDDSTAVVVECTANRDIASQTCTLNGIEIANCKSVEIEFLFL